jgi:Flp pilus assembly protein TadD
VSWGWRSSDEMADVWIQLMTRSEPDRARLAREARRKMAAEDAIGCEVLIARNPDHVDLRNDAAVIYLELREPDRAFQHFAAVGRLQPQSAVARYNMGVAREAAGRNADAAQFYLEAVQLDPNYSVAHNNLGNMRLEEGRVADARRHYQRAVESGPTNAEAHNNLGAVLLGSGDAAEALVHLELAVQLRPTYPEAHFNRGRAYALQRRFDEAIRAATIADEQAADAGKTALRAQINEQLRLYREGRQPK